MAKTKNIYLKAVRRRRMKKEITDGERIEINPRVVLGKPVIRGTRITVDFILKLFGQGMTQEEILRTFPQLEKEDLIAALNYAHNIIEEEYVYPLSKTPA